VQLSTSISGSFATCYVANVYHHVCGRRVPPAFCLHGERSWICIQDSSIERLKRHDKRCSTLLWLTRLARPQWTVGGRFGEAFPLSTSDAPPRHPVSTSLTLTVTLTLSTSDSIATSAESLHRYPDSLSLSLSSLASLRAHPLRSSAIRTEEGGSSVTRANVRVHRLCESKSNSWKAKREIETSVGGQIIYCD